MCVSASNAECSIVVDLCLMVLVTKAAQILHLLHVLKECALLQGNFHPTVVDANVLPAASGNGFAKVWHLQCAALDHHGHLCQCWRMDRRHHDSQGRVSHTRPENHAVGGQHSASNPSVHLQGRQYLLLNSHRAASMPWHVLGMLSGLNIHLRSMLASKLLTRWLSTYGVVEQSVTDAGLASFQRLTFGACME